MLSEGLEVVKLYFFDSQKLLAPAQQGELDYTLNLVSTIQIVDRKLGQPRLGTANLNTLACLSSARLGVCSNATDMISSALNPGVSMYL
jgi:hypothetical protein